MKEILIVLQHILASTDFADNSIFGDKLCSQYHEADIAQTVSDAYTAKSMNIKEIVTIMDFLPIRKRSDIYGYLPERIQLVLAKSMAAEKLSEIVLRMPHDERVDLYKKLPKSVQKSILQFMPQAEQEDVKALSKFAENTAGAMMTSDFAVLSKDITAAEGLIELRKMAYEKETIYLIYIVDQEQKLVGTISLRELIVADPDQKIGNFMIIDSVVVNTDTPKEQIAPLIQKYDILAIPVLDRDNKLVGIVTYDDAMDVAQDETETDFSRHSAMMGNFTLDIKSATIKTLYSKRVLWLVVLVFGNVFSGAGIASFEDIIASNVALVFFLPLLIDSGGNAGSQSATLMVRALATGNIVLKDWASLLFKELCVSGLLGVSMAFAVSLLGFYRGGVDIAIVVALTMQLVVIVGSIIGMSLPFLLSRFNLDPASASAPLITSIADGVGVMIYFSIATRVLQLA